MYSPRMHTANLEAKASSASLCVCVCVCSLRRVVLALRFERYAHTHTIDLFNIQLHDR